MALLRPLQHAATLLLAGVLLSFVWLREEPQFWTAAGGYPLWLRHAVLVGFYPLLVAQGGLLVCLSWQVLRWPSRHARWCGTELLLLVLYWGLLGLVLLMMVANNVANLMYGRPLHEHPRWTAAASAKGWRY